MSRTPTPRRCAVAALGVVAVVALAACSSSETRSQAPSPTAGPSATALVTKIATTGPVFSAPLDAVPASDGTATWFTATGPAGAGVFAVTETATAPLVTGAPFLAPAGLALTSDDGALLVADPAADAVYTIPVTGGVPAELAGSRGLRPRAVEVEGDRAYVTGTDPETGTGAVFALPVAGGVPEVLATGLAGPDGITVAPDGAVLVADQPGSVLRLAGGTTTLLADGIHLGTPAGLTLTADGSALLVSSLSEAGTAQVLVLDPVTGTVAGVFDDVIGANRAAGGLHRAHGSDTAAWADSIGGVYRVGTRNVPLH